MKKIIKKVLKLVLIGNLFFLSLSVLIPLIIFFMDIFDGDFQTAVETLFSAKTAIYIGLDFIINIGLDLCFFILAFPFIIISWLLGKLVDKITEVDEYSYPVGTVKEDDFDKWLKEHGNTEDKASKPKVNGYPKGHNNRYNKNTNRGYSNTYNYTNLNTNAAPDVANYNYMNMSSNNANNINSYNNVTNKNKTSGNKKADKTDKKKSFFTNRKKVNPANKSNYEDYISWQMLREEWASIQDHDDDMLKD